MNCGPITTHFETTTPDATPKAVEILQGNLSSSINCLIRMTARRQSDGAMKCWSFEVGFAIDAAGNATLKGLKGTINGGVFGNDVALNAADITLSVSGAKVFATLTGIAGPLVWCGDLDGHQIID